MRQRIPGAQILLNSQLRPLRTAQLIMRDTRQESLLVEKAERAQSRLFPRLRQRRKIDMRRDVPHARFSQNLIDTVVLHERRQRSAVAKGRIVNRSRISVIDRQHIAPIQRPAHLADPARARAD